jgi:hypothetical protein
MDQKDQALLGIMILVGIGLFAFFASSATPTSPCRGMSWIRAVECLKAQQPSK